MPSILLRVLHLPADGAPAREFGLCAVLALIVPGGCLIALALWVFRHRASLLARVAGLARARHWPQPWVLKPRALIEPLFVEPSVDHSRLPSGLNRITVGCEAAHSCSDRPASANPTSAMVFLRASACAERAAGTAPRYSAEYGRRKMHTTIKSPAAILSLTGMSLSLIALLPMLGACAGSGLYNMSDDWCAAHLQASAARCPEHTRLAGAGAAPQGAAMEDDQVDRPDSQPSSVASR